MNDTPTQQGASGNSLSQTQNPQAIASQSLGAPQSNLQNSADSLLSQTRLTISGIDTSRPATLAAQTTTTPPQTTPSYSIAPLVIGGSMALVVLAALIVLAIKKGKPSPST